MHNLYKLQTTYYGIEVTEGQNNAKSQYRLWWQTANVCCIFIISVGLFI